MRLASAATVVSGTAVTFTYTETNTGTVPITGVTVTGSSCGPATFVSSSDGNTTTLDPGAIWIYTCTETLINTGTKTITVSDQGTATGTNAITGAAAPLEKSNVVKVKVTVPKTSCGLAVTVSPNPLVETGRSEVYAVVQVEACASYANDAVEIQSTQLAAVCKGGILFGSLQPAPVLGLNSIRVVLDNDGNATVDVYGADCAPGKSLITADLTAAPYLTAMTTLDALPPGVTPTGVVGYPADEVETGDNPAINGLSDVYAVFYVETSPVYAEHTAEIDSQQLASRCLGGITWQSDLNGVTTFSTGPTATATIDNDGNAVFLFTGKGCAAGDSSVIAEIEAGLGPTYNSTYTIDPPQVTPS